MNEKCDIASISDWASERVSLFQSAGELIVIASKQQNVGRNRPEKFSKASWRSTHLVQHISFSFFRFSSGSTLSIHSSNASCLLVSYWKGEILCLQSAVCIMLLTSRIVQHFITQRFSLWDAQCVCRALECFELMREATPLDLPAIAPAPSYAISNFIE